MSAPLVFEVEVDARSVAIEVTAPRTEATPTVYPQVIFAVTPGPVGEAGPPGEGFQVFGEVLTGTRDGVNTTFTTALDYRAGSTAVFRNGLREQVGPCYVESPPRTVTFDEPPMATDDLSIDYIVTN